MTAQAEKLTGLFLADYVVGTGAAGAPRLTAKLLVDTPLHRVVGCGALTQAVSPPLDVSWLYEGEYSLLVFGAKTQVVVHLSGRPDVRWPPWGGVGPVLLASIKVTMVLDDDWQSGTASYRYTTDGQNWISVDDVPVKKHSDDASASQEGPTSPGDDALPTQTHVLAPQQVEAIWQRDQLTIRATGHEDGIRNIRIVPGPDDIAPPDMWMLLGDTWPGIGWFPYSASLTWPWPGSPPSEVKFLNPGGPPREFPVKVIPEG